MAFINYFIHLVILLGIYSILTVSLNFAVGFTGLLNLAHIGFFGIGAYASALLTMAGYPLWLSMLLAGVFASIAGIILAFPTSRLKGDYLALATLGFAFIAGSIARNWNGLTRGALGIPAIQKLAPSNKLILLFVIIITALTYLIFYKLSKSKYGKTLEAIRDDELAAKTLGKNTFAHKLSALGISAFFAGIAGSLFAHYITFIDPSIFGLPDLILVFSMMIVGGLASIEGSLIGATIILLIPEPLRFLGLPPALIGPLREMIFAAILLFILLYKPKGILGRVDFT